MLLSDNIVRMLAVSYSDHTYSLMSILLKIMIWSLPFQGLVTIYGAVLQANNNFTPVKLTGTFSSIVSIICILILYRYIGIYAIVVSFITGFIVNAVFLRINIGKKFRFLSGRFYKDRDIKLLLFMVTPIMFGVAGHEVNLIIDKSVAALVGEGAVTALSYSCVLYLLVENVIINSIVTAIFPDMAEKVQRGENVELAHNSKKAILLAEFLLIPIVIFTFFNATGITRIAYMRGNFDNNSLILTSAALQGYVIGLPFLAIRDIITRVYYAYKDTKLPVYINLLSVVINIILDFVLYKPLGIMGITLSTSVSNIFSGLIMLLMIRKYNKLIFEKNLIKELLILYSPIILSALISNVIVNLFDNIIISLILSFVVVFSIELVAVYFFKSCLLDSFRNGMNKLLRRKK